MINQLKNFLIYFQILLTACLLIVMVTVEVSQAATIKTANMTLATNFTPAKETFSTGQPIDTAALSNFSSQIPAAMIFIGISLLTIAGIIRRNQALRDSDVNNSKDMAQDISSYSRAYQREHIEITAH